MRRVLPFLLYSVAIVTGLAAAWFNLTMDSPLPIAAQAVITLGIVLLSPRKPWRWALITGGPAAFAQFLAANGLYQTPYLNEPWHAMVTLLPGLAAAYAAALFRMLPERRAIDRQYAVRQAAIRAAEAETAGETRSGDDLPVS